MSEDPKPLTRRELRRLNEAATASSSTSGFSEFFAPQPGPQDHRPGPPTILVVCTGNICRSPQADALLHTRLAPLGVRVHSAGTHALVGEPITADAARIAIAHGADPDYVAAHSARLLIEPMLDAADLILTMTAAQSAYAVQLMPRRLHSTFSVREFARLSAEVQLPTTTSSDLRERLASAVMAVSARRDFVVTPSRDEDVVDPYRRSLEVYEQSAAQLIPALSAVERVVRAALNSASHA